MRLLAVLALAACSLPVPEALHLDTDAAPAPCPPVILAGDPSSPRTISIDNGIARVSYPQLPNPDQKGAHMLELWAGGNWHRVLGDTYGDWTFYVAPFWNPAVRAHVLSATPDEAAVAFEFDHPLNFPGQYEGGCYLAKCGIPMLDFGGSVIFPRNVTTDYRRIPRVRFVKTIRMERCLPGYFVGYDADPQVVTSWAERDPYQASAGERELGLGWMSSVTFASSGTVVRNPEAGHHMPLNIVEQAVGPWWFATLPPLSYHWPYVLVMALEHPLPSFVWQFNLPHYGIPLVHKMNPQVGLDGRPERYQAFIGAAPYVMADRAAEPTQAVRDAVIAMLPPAWPD